MIAGSIAATGGLTAFVVRKIAISDAATTIKGSKEDRHE
jgi:hypothetical protein